MTYNWYELVTNEKEAFVENTIKLLSIPSVYDETTKTKEAPFGKGIDDALQFMLALGKQEGFTVKNVDGYAGHIEWGEGDELVGVLGHLDVVPPGEGWSGNPFVPEIRDGKLIARGSLDDKGPVMAAFFAMKLLKDSGIKPKRKLRLILGTDEESEWQCMKHYFKHEEMPAYGFTPDAAFPVIHAEKGLIDLLVKKPLHIKQSLDNLQLIELSGGERLNMVPQKAKAKLVLPESGLTDLEKRYEEYLTRSTYTGSITHEGNTATITCNGKSAHAMEPNNGLNGITGLVAFLATLPFQNDILEVLNDLINKFKGTRGIELGIDCEDDVSGPLTVNLGTLAMKPSVELEVGLNIRYPVTVSFEKWFTQFKHIMDSTGYTYEIIEHLKALYVEKDHPLIKQLLTSYENQTGHKGDALAIGGATYARALNQGVAFGAMFPDSKDTAHQPDEFIKLEELLKASSIYTEAIYYLLTK